MKESRHFEHIDMLFFLFISNTSVGIYIDVFICFFNSPSSSLPPASTVQQP